MPLRVRDKVEFKISKTTAEKQKFFDNIDDPAASRLRDNFVNENDGTISIADLANENVPFGDVDTVQGFYLELDGDCDITLNGGAEIIQLRRPTGQTTGNLRMGPIDATVTAINIANQQAGAVLTGTYIVWGDAP